MVIEVAKAKWKPVDLSDLEPAADGVARGERSTLVVAGPGAGKTELLAQRACFLLQTGVCPPPRRILAISFKRDAARNLRERVSKRCGRELAERFESYTFDSFSKSLVDRFLLAIPAPFRLAANYQIADQRILNERKLLDLVRSIPSDQTSLSESQMHGLNTSVVWRALIGRPLPADGNWKNGSDEETAASELWEFLLYGGRGSSVGFPMLARMAELMLRTNPIILAALRKSYRFVFLDEFQDTTSVHYGLVRRAFMDSGSVVTAVGDRKQRIMGWAGAMKKVFEQFVADFNADVVPLERNYRSAKNLVRIQSVVAKSLDPQAVNAVSMDDGEGGHGECKVLVFDDEASEAKCLSELIHAWISSGESLPRDICILCRMKPPVYTEQLRAALEAVGIRSRVENELQDLLSEPLSECFLDMLKLACRANASEAWGRTVALLGELRGDSSDVAMRKAVDELIEFTKKLKQQLDGDSATEAQIEPILRDIVRFVGEDGFRSRHPQYLQGDWYSQVAKSLVEALAAARLGREWNDAIDEVEGVDSVPIMTTHKSKGLEYHTIIFVGLEDGAHFSFESNRAEETCGFFVALSRAKKRVIFTFSGVRRSGRGGSLAKQQREALEPLYDLLKSAGVTIEA